MPNLNSVCSIQNVAFQQRLECWQTHDNQELKCNNGRDCYRNVNSPIEIQSPFNFELGWEPGINKDEVNITYNDFVDNKARLELLETMKVNGFDPSPSVDDGRRIKGERQFGILFDYRPENVTDVHKVILNTFFNIQIAPYQEYRYQKYKITEDPFGKKVKVPDGIDPNRSSPTKVFIDVEYKMELWYKETEIGVYDGVIPNGNKEIELGDLTLPGLYRISFVSTRLNGTVMNYGNSIEFYPELSVIIRTDPVRLKS